MEPARSKVSSCGTFQAPLPVVCEVRRDRFYERPLQQMQLLTFLSADRSSISKICLSGVATKFHRRIADRPSELKMQWKADISNARVISNRAVDLNLPGYEDTGVQQVVVRIASKQTLDLYDASEQARKNGAVHRPKTDKTVEYLVLQRQVINNKVKDWKIWGFMDESTKSSIEKDAHTKKMINDYQTASATA